MKDENVVLMVVIVFVVLLVIAYVAVSQSVSHGQYDEFAQCLTENGASMYGTSWCSHCNDQKNSFGSSFDYVDFTDCDVDGDLCRAAGVRGYPTWIINGDVYPGSKTLQELSALSGCSLG